MDGSEYISTIYDRSKNPCKYIAASNLKWEAALTSVKYKCFKGMVRNTFTRIITVRR